MQIKPATRQGVRPFKKHSVAGKKNPRWKGGKIITIDGRVMIYSPNHPRPSKGRYVYRYRLIMEEILGRVLEPSEVVHHKNGVNHDDRPDNLELLGNREHSLLHASQRSWSRKHSCCIQCGTTSVKHKGHGLCARCMDKKRWPNRRKHGA